MRWGARKVTKIHWKNSIWIACSPAEIWDFTQDYSRRASWDRSVVQATVEQEHPVRIAHVLGKGGFDARFQYKQYERPVKTSLAMIDVRSSLVCGGGGSWSYAEEGAGTRWTLSNTLVLRDSWWVRLIAPLIAWWAKRETDLSIARAKWMLENPDT